MSFSSLIVAVFFSIGFRDAWSAVDSSALLWPMPAQIQVAENPAVKMLDQDKFNFETSINSAVLDQAFQRYKGIIFQSPIPFFPDGAPLNIKEELAVLNVTVTSGDTTLNLATDDSCKHRTINFNIIIISD